MNQIDNLQTTSYQFKICVTLQEYPQSVFCLEKVITFISEYSFEEIEILNRLANELLKKTTKLLNAVYAIHLNSENSFCESKYHNKIVLDDYSRYLQKDSIELIKRLLVCLEVIIVKVTEVPSKALCSKIIGKVNSFLSIYADGDCSNINRPNYLESALISYKQVLSFAIEQLNTLTALRLRIILSYCKFISKYMKDYYRSMLLCMNIIEEIHTSLAKSKNENEDEESNKSIQSILVKFKLFYDENINEYNKTVLKYFP